jgi:hypothetical protein
MDMNLSFVRRPLLRRLRERLIAGVAIRFDRDAGAIVCCPRRFRLREVSVDRVYRVEAGNRDDILEDTLFLFFHVEGEETLVVSELDKGFAALVGDLRLYFPGIEGWQRAVPPVAFQLTSVDLWTRSGARNTSARDAAVDSVA